MDYKELMTCKERQQMMRREAIAAALSAGWTYNEIERELGASTGTIALVARLMREGKKWNI